MLRIPHANTAAVVQADPSGAAGGVEQRVEQRPVADRITAVPHGFGLAVGGGDRAAVEVVAANHDGCLEFTGANHLVEGQARDVAFTQPNPANAGWQPLKSDALSRHVQPPVQPGVLGKQLLHFCVGLADVFGVTAQRHPAERPHTPAKQRAHVGGHKAGVVKGIGHPKVFGHLAQVVAVVHRGDAHGMKVQHGLHLHGAGFTSGLGEGRVLGGVFARLQPALHGPAGRQVAIDQVVGGGLVGDDIGADGAAAGATHQFRHHLGGIGAQTNRDRFTAFGMKGDQGQRFVQRCGLFVQVACAQSKVNRALLALDVQRAGACKSGGQWLRATHAAQSCGQHPTSGEVSLVMLTTGFHEGLVGALHDALRANVDPAAGGHLSVHHQPGAVQLIEVRPGRPFGHQIRVGNQHTGCLGVGAKHANRLAALDQQGLVFLKLAQAVQDAVKAGPVAGCLANAAIHHQFIGVFGHLGVQVVLQHPVGGLNGPIGAGEGGATRGTHRASLAVGVRGVGQVRHSVLGVSGKLIGAFEGLSG